MKIGIISDIHGNFPALNAVMSELKKHSCDCIICLGDVAGYYSMVNECIDLLRTEKVLTLKGNHDSYLLGEGKCPRSNSVNRCIDYQKSIISKDSLQWLSTLLPRYTCEIFDAVHGGWMDNIDEYVEQFDFEYAKKHMSGIKVFLSGHTHKQQLQRNGDMIYCNPGSVGQPRDYDARAAYAIYENGDIALHRVKYDIDQIAIHMSKSGFTDYFYKNLYEGKKIGEK